ncbi:MAG: metallophosphoesterase [Phycisphaerales bacterium]
MYDVIGDIHGQRPALERLLRTLGYDRQGELWRHRDRTAIFVGDLVDRGPDSPGTVDLVRTMVEAGTARAVMGNHEYNLLAMHTWDPETGAPARPHGPRQREHVRRTLEQYGGSSDAIAEPAGQLALDLDWMRRLPTHLDLGGLRIVHATWDPPSLARLTDLRPVGEAFDRDAILATGADGTDSWRAIETVLKGREGRTPDGVVALDAVGRPRRRMRLRWFDAPEGRTWRDYVLQPGLELPDAPLPERVVNEARPYPADAPPVLFGHYCLPEPGPVIFGPNVGCVDIGAGKGWRLGAYRWDGERELMPEHGVAIDV